MDHSVDRPLSPGRRATRQTMGATAGLAGASGSGNPKMDHKPVRIRRGAMTSAAGWCAIGALVFCGGRAYAEGDAGAGKTVFANQCASCHTIEAGKNGFGPSLAAVLGRKAGGLAGFTYSPAMAQAGLIWDEKNLDEFLTSSTAKVPGTSMPVQLPSASDRANVIAYLETLGRASAAAPSAPAASTAGAPSAQGPTQDELLHA